MSPTGFAVQYCTLARGLHTITHDVQASSRPAKHIHRSDHFLTLHRLNNMLNTKLDAVLCPDTQLL